MDGLLMSEQPEARRKTLMGAYCSALGRGWERKRKRKEASREREKQKLARSHRALLAKKGVGSAMTSIL